MFQLKFDKLYNNTIFTKYNMSPVVEDYYVVKENAFCVADGVTRDSIYGEAICYPQSKEEVEEWISVYPNPSGAHEAAKICAKNFVSYISTTNDKLSKELIFRIAKKVNNDIGKINENREIDYLANDLFCCVAVGGVIVNNKLFCFSIGDCHITALDENFNTQFTTINNHLQFEDYLNNIYCKKHEFNWDKVEDRAMVRRDYRNKPQMKYNGKEVSFGALTGEEEAEHYIDVYEVDLSNVKYICAYSDGCEPFFESKERIQEIIKEPNKLKNEGKERTLIIYEKNK